MIRGRAASFFDLEWAFDKYSRILICNKCTKYIGLEVKT